MKRFILILVLLLGGCVSCPKCPEPITILPDRYQSPTQAELGAEEGQEKIIKETLKEIREIIKNETIELDL